MNKLTYLLSLFSILILSCKKEIKLTENDQTRSYQTDETTVSETTQKQSWEGVYAFTKPNQPKNYNYLIQINKDHTILFIDRNRIEYKGQIIENKETSLVITIDHNGSQEMITMHSKYNMSVSEGILNKDEVHTLTENGYKTVQVAIEDIDMFSSQHGNINSKNGLSIRQEPSLDSEKVSVIPFKGKVAILSSSKKYDYITLSGNKKVVGEWKRVSYDDKEGSVYQGYVFDKFIHYDVDIYDLPLDRSSEDPERTYVDIYNAEQFFDNLGNMTTLNIKVEKLDLAQYIRDNLRDIDILTDSQLYDHSDLAQGFYYHKREDITIMLKGYYDLEIRSDGKAEIKTYPLIFASFYGFLFNNLKFELVTNDPYDKLINIDDSSIISFYNIDFYDHQGIDITDSYEAINFVHCDFNGIAEFEMYYNSFATVNQCKFYNNTEEYSIYLETVTIEEQTTELLLSNSYFGHNEGIKNVIVVNRFPENPLFEVTLENNTYEENENLEEIIKEIRECC